MSFLLSQGMSWEIRKKLFSATKDIFLSKAASLFSETKRSASVPLSYCRILANKPVPISEGFQSNSIFWAALGPNKIPESLFY
jgi:hypothetical protein